MQSAFGYQGQKCSACSRAIVDEAVYDEFVEKLKERFEADCGSGRRIAGLHGSGDQ